MCAAEWDWGWFSLVVVGLVVGTSSLASGIDQQEARADTLMSLVSRLFQNLPSLKQALYAPRPALFVDGRNRKDDTGGERVTLQR